MLNSNQYFTVLYNLRDEIIARLRQDIDMERETKERLIQGMGTI
jgi:hypothetical protein